MYARNINIVFSATRQWNPGDEFIMMGCINLLKNNFPFSFNPLIYNRNPQTQNGASIFYYDNSISDRIDASIIDLVIFAGSPEWYGPYTQMLYKICEKNNIPVCYMGIGLGIPKTIDSFSELELTVLKNAKFITTRDKAARDLLERFRASHIPCPALFASMKSKKIKKVKKIGLIYATHKTIACNNINEQASIFLNELYSTLLLEYDGRFIFEFIAHYIEEITTVRLN